jgi:hypothetical protein
MLARADQAMFNVKSKGKNAVGDISGSIYHPTALGTAVS